MRSSVNCDEHTLFEWTWEDAKGDQVHVVKVNGKFTKCTDKEGVVWSLSGVMREGGDLERLREVVSMKWDDQKLTRESGRWKPSIESTETSSQMRWRSDGLEWRDLWRKGLEAPVQKKLKCFWMDALHTNLAVRYQKDCCELCGSVVGSGHFFYECDKYSVAEKAIRADGEVMRALGSCTVAVRMLVCRCLWRAHCDSKHGKKSPLSVSAAKEIQKFKCWKRRQR